MELKFFVIGKIPSKANYKKISHRFQNGSFKPFIINDPEVLRIQEEAVLQLKRQKKLYRQIKFPIEKPVKISIKFFFSSRVSQRDLDNAEKFVGDILEKSEILKKDSLIYVKERVEKRKGKKDVEVIEINITPLSDEEIESLNSPFENLEEILKSLGERGAS